MAINVAGLVPASIKSKNVATEDYVDTSVASNVVSNNLIKNSEMIIESVRTGTKWLRSDLWHRRNSGLDTYTAGVTRNKIGEYSPYTLLNGATAWIHQNGSEPEFSADLIFDDNGIQFTYLGHIVSHLEWYQVSGYIGSINCEAKIVVVFSDGVGQIVNQVVGEALTGKPGGSYLEDFHNYYMNVPVPVGARYATIIFRKYGTTSGSDSLMFVSKPQFINTVGSSTRRIQYSENGNASGLSGMAYTDMRNVTTIDGGKIVTSEAFVRNLNATGGVVADTVKSYSLTSTNATIENGLITNAKIADLSVTNAKIADLSVGTLKIQDEAVIVPRAATGVGSTTIYYTPSVTHSVVFLLTGGFSAYNTIYRLYVNGVVWYESPVSYGESIALNILGTLYANTAYTITLNATVQRGYGVPTLQLVMLGVKK